MKTVIIQPKDAQINDRARIGACTGRIKSAWGTGVGVQYDHSVGSNSFLNETFTLMGGVIERDVEEDDLEAILTMPAHINAPVARALQRITKELKALKEKVK